MIEKAEIRAALVGASQGGGIRFSNVQRFDNPSSEEWIWIVCGPRSSFSNFSNFWIEAFGLTYNNDGNDLHEQLLEIDCQLISAADFFESIRNHLASPRWEKSIITSLQLPDAKSITSIFKLKDLWNEKIYVAEDSTNYYLIIWETSA